MAATRRAYTGAAVSTTTSSAIAASGTTSFTITAYTGWPYGTDPFYVVVEPGTASEEKILVTRTGSTDTTINVASDSERGQDGTSAVSHSSGATVFPVFTSVDADEANAVASVITADTTNSRIGIGTDTPAHELDVVGSGEIARFSGTGSPRISILATDGSDPYFVLGNDSDASLAGLYYDSSTDIFGIRGNNFTTRMAIDSAGRVGINDTSPSYTLDVDGDINATGDVRIAGTAIGRGVMGYTRNTSPPSLTTSEQDLATITFTAVSGRLYFATAAFVSFGYDNSGVLTGKIYADSTRIAEEVFPVPNTTIDYAGATISGYFTGSGSVTVDLRANMFGAATSASISTTGNVDPYLLILDVGPA